MAFKREASAFLETGYPDFRMGEDAISPTDAQSKIASFLDYKYPDQSSPSSNTATICSAYTQFMEENDQLGRYGTFHIYEVAAFESFANTEKLGLYQALDNLFNQTVAPKRLKAEQAQNKLTDSSAGKLSKILAESEYNQIHNAAMRWHEDFAERIGNDPQVNEDLRSYLKEKLNNREDIRFVKGAEGERFFLLTRKPVPAHLLGKELRVTAANDLTNPSGADPRRNRTEFASGTLSSASRHAETISNMWQAVTSPVWNPYSGTSRTLDRFLGCGMPQPTNNLLSPIGKLARSLGLGQSQSA